MRNSRLLWTLVLLVTFITLTANAQQITELARRQDEGSKESTSTSVRVRSTTTTNTADEEESESRTTPPPKETNTDEDGGDGKSGDRTSSSIRVRESESIRTRSTTTRVNPNAPPGGIQMVTPAATDGFQLYPIGATITWSYNYTSLLITPTAINVEAFCSRTQQYYTIANNYSVNERKIIWDTDKYQSSQTPQLAAETYTLLMYDSATQKTDVPVAGKLAIFRTFQFAMYTPRGNIPLNEYECPTCSTGSSIWDSHGLRVLMGTAMIAAISFAWFVHGVM